MNHGQISWKKNTAIFLGGQLISLFGSAIVQFAITWHITLTTQSGVYMTLAIICGFVPTLLLSPFAGVWADRYNRKILIVVSDGCIALTTLILAMSIMLGNDSLWPLFAALGIRALGAAVQMPCIGAILPSIVPVEHLTRVNGINGSAQSIINLASPMLSAVLLKAVPYFSIFLIDVTTALIAIFIMLAFFRLPARTEASAEQGTNYFAEMKQGILYVFKTKYLKALFGFFAVILFLSGPVAFLTPLQVTRNYGGDEFYLMAIEIAFSVGMIFGGVLIASWGGFKNRIHSIALAMFVLSVCTLVLGLEIPLWLYLAMMGIFGLFMPVFNTPANVLLQEKVPPEYIGRVYGVMTMISSGGMPLSMLVFGPVADIIAIEWLLLGTGALMALLSFLIIRNRTLIEAGRQGAAG